MLAPILNRLLTHDEPARTKLAAFSGKIVTFDTPPLSLTTQINERGFLVELPTAPNTPAPLPDLKISLPMASFPLAVLGKDRMLQEARIEGNIALGNAFNTMLSNLPLAIEQETESKLGPIAAHGLAQAGQRFAQGLKALHDSVTRNAAVALTKGEDSPLPRAEEMRDWSYGINGVASRVHALEQRIARLG